VVGYSLPCSCWPERCLMNWSYSRWVNTVRSSIWIDWLRFASVSSRARCETFVQVSQLHARRIWTTSTGLQIQNE
jgi:hypothetical protein